MGGPPCILVDSLSARHTRPWENEAHNCIGMKRDHSALVKFSPNDSDYDEVLAKLNRMALTAVSTIPRGISGQLKLKQLTENEKKVIEDSLKFNRMETRFFDIEAATTATCDWLFSIPEYDQWLDNNLVPEHHGFLWIKGKPGSGKSTIMKHAIEAATNSDIPSIIVTFFFNARGTELERSILGMYRSVLLQIISKTPTILDDLSHLFSSKIKHGQVYEWNIGELQAILITMMKGAREYPVIWFIDALDECKADEVLKLVKFFENIGHTAVSSRSSLRICLSTRHYPNIPIRRGIQLTLEEQDGHDQDIVTYIDSEFRAPHNLHVARIKDELRTRSSGVFIWVRLAVELLNAAFRRGDGTPGQLQLLLDSVPEELNDLFTNILKADPISKDKSILCFQWVLFSTRSLKPEELYFAIITGTEPTAIGKWDTDEIDSEGIEKFILHISKGLVEVSKTHGTVQFIHEAVRDFLLLHDGFAKLEHDLATNVRGFSEERLKHCCYQYLVLGVFKDSYCSPTQLRPTPPLDSERKDPDLRPDIIRRFPFARYAVRYVFAHADAAQGCCIDQREFLADFEAPDRTLINKWTMLHNDLHYSKIPMPTTMIYDFNDSLIYRLSFQNLPNLLLILIQNKGDVNAVGKQHGSPLQLAAWMGYITIARHLIAAGADIEFTDNGETSKSLRPLLSAFYTGHGDVALLLLENGARRDVVDGQPPLIIAAAQGHIAIVQKLLQLGDGADVQGGRALQEAAGRGEWEIVRLLLESGADANSGGVLQAAAANWNDGNVEILQLLLQSGANVNKADTKHGSALQSAAFRGCELAVRLLLHEGADVNIRGGHYDGDALLLAAQGGYDEIVQLLLHAGANVNSEGSGHYGSVLQAAASNKHEKVVRLLLQAGANVNSVGGNCGSALHVAAREGNEKVTRLLLNAGANVNSIGGSCGSALQAAVEHGHSDIAQLLRQHRAKKRKLSTS